MVVMMGYTMKKDWLYNPKDQKHITNYTGSPFITVCCSNVISQYRLCINLNKLKLNPDKAEFIMIGDDQIRSSLKSSFPVSFLGNIMEPAE